MLRIQVSSSGPPRDQRLRGQGTNSRHNQEATYPGNVEPFPDMCGVRLNKGPLPTYLAPQDESPDSTRVSSKRQCNKRPQLFDTMRARLGPHAPCKDRPHTTTTRETYPSPSIVPITRGYPLHQSLRQVGGNSANEPPRAPLVSNWTTCSPRL